MRLVGGRTEGIDQQACADAAEHENGKNDQPAHDAGSVFANEGLLSAIQDVLAIMIGSGIGWRGAGGSACLACRECIKMRIILNKIEW
jgi:hypothetical protein